MKENKHMSKDPAYVRKYMQGWRKNNKEKSLRTNRISMKKLRSENPRRYKKLNSLYLLEYNIRHNIYKKQTTIRLALHKIRNLRSELFKE